MDSGSALAHLESVVCSTDGPAIEAWPAKPDDDTSKGLPSLVSVDSSLGFTVVVIEPPTGLTFVALATGESHDHCMLPHLEGQWSALFEQPYGGCSSKGIRLTDGILRDNQTLAVLAAQMQSSAAISPDKANQLWEGPLGHKMIDWCYVNASADPLASDRLRLWLWAVAGIGVTKPQGSVHKGQVYYRCYKHLSEANALRYVMGVSLIVEPEGTRFSAAAPTAAVSAITSPLRNQAELTQASCNAQHIKMLRDILAPGAIAAWVSKDSQADPQGWQKNLLNRVIDACRLVPEASVPADLLREEPIITSSLELVMKSVINLLAEAVEKLKSADQTAQEFAAKERASEAAHSTALASASAAAAREKMHAVEDARPAANTMWAAEKLSHATMTKELEDKVASQSSEISGLKVQISNTNSDFKSVCTEKEAAVSSARSELQRRHDSENAALCLLVKKMADHLQVVLPKWSGGARDRSSASAPDAVPAPEPAPEKPSFPNDLTNKANVQKCLSKWTEYFTDHALKVDRNDLKKIMSLVGMMEAYKALQCPGKCLKCGDKIGLYPMPTPDGTYKCVQHLDSEGEPTGVKAGECDLEAAHSCPLCESIAFNDCNHIITMCPLKPDKVAALVANKTTSGYVTSAASLARDKAEKKAARAKSRDSAQKKPFVKSEPHDQYESSKKGKGPNGKGGGPKGKGGKKKDKKPVKKESARPRKRARSGSDSA